jgi:hypothetical protein
VRQKLNSKDKGQMSIANENTGNFYFAYFELQDLVNATYNSHFESNHPVEEAFNQINVAGVEFRQFQHQDINTENKL